MSKKTNGRQKVELVKMSKKSNMQVTFTKRKSGLFRRASELTTLCGAEVAIVLFSPGDKAFSFGQPGVQTVVNRYLNRNVTPQPSLTMQLIEAHRNANIRELSVQFDEISHQLHMERKRGEELTKMRKASQAQCWWESPVEDLSLTQLEQLKVSLEELRKNVAEQANKILNQHSTTSNTQQHFGPNSSAGGVHLPDQNANISRSQQYFGPSSSIGGVHLPDQNANISSSQQHFRPSSSTHGVHLPDQNANILRSQHHLGPSSSTGGVHLPDQNVNILSFHQQFGPSSGIGGVHLPDQNANISRSQQHYGPSSSTGGVQLPDQNANISRSQQYFGPSSSIYGVHLPDKTANISSFQQHFGPSSSTGGVHLPDQNAIMFNDLNPNMVPCGHGHGYNNGHGRGFY